MNCLLTCFAMPVRRCRLRAGARRLSMAAWPALLLFVSAMPLAAQDDYGDAPLPYPTLLSANGARHRVTPGFFLGTGVTTETNGQPDVDASLDVGDDGVTFLSPLAAGNSNVVRVVASANGRLDAWIDFNNNGSWSDPGEQVFRSVLLSPGANDLTFFIPAGAVGRTYARFRFSTAGELAPTGFASDGEVEDYRINIPNSAADLAIS